MTIVPGPGIPDRAQHSAAPPIGLLGGRRAIQDLDLDAAGMDVGLLRPVLGASTVVLVMALFFSASHLRVGEALLSAAVARRLGIGSAHQVGPVVLFLVEGVPTGYEISLGCTVAFLVVPFLAVTGLLLSLRRVPVSRSVLALAAALVIIVAFNQLRLVAIALGMREWGPEVGYAIMHLLPGTLISTVGVVLGGMAYLAILLRGTFTRAGAHHG